MPLQVDIEKDFGSFHLKVKFQAKEGIMGILGASGSGKSMTLRCIAGIEKPDRGKIVFNEQTLFDSEKKINLSPQKRRIGLLFQHYALFPNMTMRQNLITGLLPYEKDKRKREREAAQMMKRFCLEGLGDHKPFQLSGGQQQRTALARILLSRPGLLMLDEPFSALDGYLRWKMELELLDMLHDFSGPILFVSHSRDEVYRICSRACVMDRGSSSPVISVKELFERPDTLAAARLSGCKNYSKAQVTGKNQMRALDWGVVLNSSQPTDRGITHVGVRSHFFHLIKKEECHGENCIQGKIVRIIEDVFSMVIMVEPENMQGQQIRLEMTKEEWRQHDLENSGNIGDPIWFYVNRQDVMPLKEE